MKREIRLVSPEQQQALRKRMLASHLLPDVTVRVPVETPFYKRIRKNGQKTHRGKLSDLKTESIIFLWLKPEQEGQPPVAEFIIVVAEDVFLSCEQWQCLGEV